MVNNLVFRWPKPLFFVVLGAHGRNKYMECGKCGAPRPRLKGLPQHLGMKSPRSYGDSLRAKSTLPTASTVSTVTLRCSCPLCGRNGLLVLISNSLLQVSNFRGTTN